jgi:hypothetical protein
MYNGRWGCGVVFCRLLFGCSIWLCTAALSLAVACTVASAAITHEFLEPLTRQLEKGPSAGCGVEPPETEPPCVSGPLSLVNALTDDSGHLWVAEHVERAGKQFGSRVDEFNDSTGAFLRQLNEEHGVSELDQAIAVGRPGGEEEVYVGAAGPKGSVVAVFGPSGKLQPEGVWSGEHTPSKSFAQVEGMAVDASANLETHGEVYVATRGATGTPKECEESLEKKEATCAVDVFPGEAGGKEPVKVISQLTGTCETASEIPPACTGSKFLPFANPRGVAVSSVNGDVLVSEGFCIGGEPECGVDVLEPVSGMPGVYSFLFKITGAPGEPFKSIGPMAVDGKGDIYVVEKEANAVDQFNAAGEFVTQLKGTAPDAPFKSVQSVAADPASGSVYVGDFDTQGQRTGAVDAFGPSVIVPDVTTSAATGVRVNVQGRIEATFTGTIDPLNQGEAKCHFASGTSKAFGQSTPCQPEGVANGNAAVPAQATINEKLTPTVVLAPDTTYFFRLQASNKNGTNLGEESQDQELLTPGPGIHSESASEVSSTSATLGATINPNGASTSYYFQYGRTTTYEEPPVPAVPGAPLGSGAGDVQVAPKHVQSLESNTVYHYRVVAVSQLEVEGSPKAVSFAGPDQAFTTQGAVAGGALPDGRRWELVSPPNKHGSLLLPIPEGVIQASASGGAVTYLASIPTEEGVKGYLTHGVQVMSTRGEGAWSSHDISLAHATVFGLPVGEGNEYRFFSPDLSLALVEPFGEFSSLAPEVFPPDTEGTPYVRHDATCATTPASCFQPLLTGAPGYADVPEGTKFGGAKSFVGATPDLAHVILSARVPLTSTPTEGEELYEWSAGRPTSERLQLVSLLPTNKPAEENPAKGNVHLGFENTVARHAVSEEGSRVMWSNEAHLYLRDLARAKTTQLDVPDAQCLSTGECGGGQEDAKFQLASADGSRVLFTDTQQLTKNASRTPGTADLYECDMVEEAGKLQCKLSDFTPSPGPRKAADVQGAVMGASEDGTWVYFVANGVLGDGGEHGATRGDCKLSGTKGEGQCNLYVYHGGATHFITVLAGEDYSDWAGNGARLDQLAARVSPDGGWLAFMSNRSLTGYDNHDAVSGKPDEEVFLYHAEAGTAEGLVCASCNPSGARPVGVESATLESGIVGSVENAETWLAANIPGWTPYTISHALYQSRYLSDSGRLFFNSNDALVPQDINKNQDVYQYEPAGVGDCSSASSTFHAASGGCVALISSGRAAGESAFLDASENGNDVFFLTAERLVHQDVDTALDVYDAHVCSPGAPCFEEAERPPACSTVDSCRTAPSPQPGIFGAPSSSTFSGPSNLSPVPPLTKAQQLAKALSACRGNYKRSKKRRAACERQARKRYGARRARKADTRKGRNR